MVRVVVGSLRQVALQLLAYYAIGGNYGLAKYTAAGGGGGGGAISPVTDVEGDCGTTDPVNLHLTSK